MSPSIRTMGFFMSEINFCNTKEQLNHLGEVVTGKVDGSPSGSDIETSTLSYTGQVRKTLPALESEYETSIATKQAEAEAAIDEYRLLNKGSYAAGITLESKFEYITYNGESYFATNPPYTTTATTPDADGNLFAGGYTTLDEVARNLVDLTNYQATSVADMKSGLSGNVSYLAIANKGAVVKTTFYRDRPSMWATLRTSPEPNGGASYEIWTLEAYRNSISDQSWIPDEMRDHTLYDGAVAVLLFGKGRVYADQFGADPYGQIESSQYIQAAIDSNVNDVILSSGFYELDKQVWVQRASQSLIGQGKGSTVLIAKSSFQETETGGDNAACMIRWQADGQWTDSDWIIGGTVGGFALDCRNNNSVEGIRQNRVTSSGVIKDVRIRGASIGINGTKYGWLLSFENLYIEECVNSSIRLDNGYNGLTFKNVFLYGGTIDTSVHLDLLNDCYGNSWVGGAIEGCLKGVRTRNAQISFFGTDFEVCREKFAEHVGNYTGTTLNFASPMSNYIGCTFVSVPSVCGISAQGAAVNATGNYIQGIPGSPAAVPFFDGIAGVDIKTGVPQQCISESNNQFRYWGDNISRGVVFDSGTQGVYKKFTAGSTDELIASDAPYDMKAVQAAFTPSLTRAFVPQASADREIINIRSRSAQSLYGANVDEWMRDNPELYTGQVLMTANDQAANGVLGKTRIGAYRVSQANARIGAIEVHCNTFTGAFAPVTDNILPSGSSSERWTEVFAVNSSINTSDRNEKTDFNEITPELKAAALEIKSNIQLWKWISAKAEKGDEARFHVGPVAQDVYDICIRNGVDNPFAYGIIGKDDLIDEDTGDIVGERWSIRPIELIWLILSAI